MAFQSRELFSFLAFDDNSGAIMAHGSTAVSALDRADRMDPTAPIRIIFVGDIGLTIWAKRMGFDAACKTTAIMDHRLIGN